jgi:hypothetical protein
MPSKFSPLLLTLLTLSLILSACRPAPAEVSPTPVPDTILTAAAQTAAVRMTELAVPTPSPEQRSPLPPTDTPAPVTPTVQSTATPTLSLLATITPTGGLAGGDKAEYVSDITIPDGTDLAPGAAFTKTWRLQNTGTSVWTTNYALAFMAGAQMGGPEAVPLTQSVGPGETVDISVNLVAPLESGNYQGFWEMRNAGGQLFPNAVFVDIDVVGGTPSAGGTAAPTAEGTAPPSGDSLVSDLSLSVDDASPDECPNTFNFTASFTLSNASAITFELQASTNTPGFEFDLPGSQTEQFGAGDHSMLYNLDVANSVEADVQFHISSPNELTSNSVAISLDCP